MATILWDCARYFNIHFPQKPEDKDDARRRLVFDELFSIQLQMAHRRYQYERREDALTLKYTPDPVSYVGETFSYIAF